ncbi:hypothetical protein Tco_0465767 [Tanacetum coccineum]
MDQDSEKFPVGGNFLDKMPRDCLRISESKEPKFRNSLVQNQLMQKFRDIVEFEPDPTSTFNSGEEFLKDPVDALIDVYEGEITLRVGREAITFNLDQTSRYKTA